MSDNKKYYYIKLKDHYFDQDNIKILEAQENGYIYSLIIIKMYLKSAKHEGRLMMTDSLPYSPEKVDILARVLNHDVSHVRDAIRAASELDLITIIDSGQMWMNQIQNLIGHASSEADRKRRYRKQLETIQNGTNVPLEDRTNVPKTEETGQMSGQSSTRERVRVKDRDKELKKEKEKYTETATFQPEEFEPEKVGTIDDLVTYWNGIGNLPKSVLSINFSKPGKMADILNDLGYEYLSEAILNLSANYESLEKRYSPSSLEKFMLNGSVGYWHDYEPEKKKTKIDISKIEEASFDNF